MTGFGEAPGGLDDESGSTENVAGGADDVSGRTDDQSGGDAVSDGDADRWRDDQDGVESVDGRPCPLCGVGMTHRHCEYVCPQHGVVYDCSDTFY